MLLAGKLLANGIGVAVLNVPPFIMTLGMLSMALGVALTLSGGYVVYGIPDEFSVHFGHGRPFGVPAPIYFTAGLSVLVYFLLNRTRMGRYLYAVGGNRRAARLSGISTRTRLFMAYFICGLLAGVVDQFRLRFLGQFKADRRPVRALSEHQARVSDRAPIFRIPSGPAVNAPRRKGRIHDCKPYRRFNSVFPLQHRGRPYMTVPS